MEQRQKGPDLLNFSEMIDEIRSLLLGSWRFRWQAILLAWFICLPIWWIVLSMPDVYKASGRMYIDTDDSLRPLLRGLAIQSDLLDDVNVMLKSIMSRPTLEKIAMKSGFDLGNLDEAEQGKIVRRLGEKIDLGLDRNKILEISIDHSNPEVALAVVSVLIDEFVEGLLGSNRSDTKIAQDFLQKKLGEYEERLSESEARLADFKKRNIGNMPGERGGYYSRLQSEMRRLESLNLKIRLARQRRDNLEQQMAGEAPVFGMMPLSASDGSASSPQIAKLEAQLNSLRLSYTDSHPDVIRIKELLARLRDELSASQIERGGNSVVSRADMNPVYQQMKIQFSEAELTLSQLITERAVQAALVKNLQEKIDTIPEIEAELKRLDRSYGVYKSQYSELLARLEKARLSEDADKNASMKFRLIDPPIVSSSPVGPNRKFFVTVGLLLSIIAGVGVAVLMSLVSPVISSSRQLELLFGMPVLGTIKRIRSSEETMKATLNAAILSCAILGLISFYAVIILFGQQSTQLVQQLSTLIG